MQTISDLSLTQLSQDLADLFITHNLRLAAAESCTGGWLAKCCTDIEGSSQWFERGFVTYSNEAKQSLLGVKQTTLSDHGAVSQQTAEAMAQGAIANSLANISVGITGIAGPAGGSTDKPVGTVWIAWATNTSINSHCYHFTGDRDAVRRQAVFAALSGIIKNARD